MNDPEQRGPVSRLRYERERAARREAERLLEEKSRELYEAKRARERFLVNINHEFRTPLNGILGPAQLMQEGNYPEGVRDFGRVIEACGREVLQLFKSAIEASDVADPNDDGADTSIQAPLVLVVDDNVVNRMVARAAIEAVGMRTIQAENGREAIDLVCERQPDAVIMDLQMPVMSGEEAIRFIRASNETWRDLPIIVLTADAEPHGFERYRKLGATDYMTKPLIVRKLQARLSELVTEQRPN